jgi:membrane protease YdiL (CAAX protease family)
MISATKRNIGVVIIVIYFAGEFILDLIGTTLMLLIADEGDKLSLYSNLNYIRITIIYGLLVILIGLEAKNLSKYHLDRTSLIFLIFFGPLYRSLPRVPNKYIYLAIILIFSLVMLIVVIINWPKIPRTNFKVNFQNIILVGIVIIVIIGLEAMQPTIYSQADPQLYNPTLDFVQRFIKNFTSVAPIEEIIYRGFLWGLLLQFGWGETKVIFIQAGIFILAHLSRALVSPITFFATIPIFTLLLSLIVYKTKQVFWAIIVHTVANVIPPVLLTLIFLNI